MSGNQLRLFRSGGTTQTEFTVIGEKTPTDPRVSTKPRGQERTMTGALVPGLDRVVSYTEHSRVLEVPPL